MRVSKSLWRLNQFSVCHDLRRSVRVDKNLQYLKQSIENLAWPITREISNALHLGGWNYRDVCPRQRIISWRILGCEGNYQITWSKDKEGTSSSGAVCFCARRLSFVLFGLLKQVRCVWYPTPGPHVAKPWFPFSTWSKKSVDISLLYEFLNGLPVPFNMYLTLSYSVQQFPLKTTYFQNFFIRYMCGPVNTQETTKSPHLKKTSVHFEHRTLKDHLSTPYNTIGQI